MRWIAVPGLLVTLGKITGCDNPNRSNHTNWLYSRLRRMLQFHRRRAAAGQKLCAHNCSLSLRRRMDPPCKRSQTEGKGLGLWSKKRPSCSPWATIWTGWTCKTSTWASTSAVSARRITTCTSRPSASPSVVAAGRRP